jgi:gamma-glutamyltranspeptidase/glutathione hydrolase
MTDLCFDQPYCSRRSPLLARNIVATSQPLAAQAGLRMLLSGGNAVDAALAAAITLTVVEPTSNGIGADAFAIVWDGRALHGLNASGRSPAAWTREYFDRFNQMPVSGWHSVTVPGAVSGWVELSKTFGKLPFEQLFEPAIAYARDGFLVSPITARAWARGARAFADFAAFQKAFTSDGRVPRPGESFVMPDHAATLESIARTRGESFYRGELAARIVAASSVEGGLMSADDLASHRPEWSGTIACDYRGQQLHEIPPNGQGLAALLALNILSSFSVADYPVDSADSLHLQIEAMKLALADAYRYVSDPAHMTEVTAGDLLDPNYARERSKLIDPKRATIAAHGVPKRGGTVYLTAADASGMMVSFIQSNYYGFGSGVVIPDTGIAMQNRGYGFVLDRDHPNCVGPRKRPFHTIIPGFVMRDGAPLMSFGVMGGPMQAQGHVQMMTRILDYGQNPQAASDAPRWQVTGGLEVLIERGFAPDVLDDLRSRGHELKLADPESFGGAQLIYRIEDGYVAGSDHRKDGCAVGF